MLLFQRQDVQILWVDLCFTTLSVVEAKTIAEIVIGTDVPKIGGGTRKWAKVHYANGKEMIYDSLLCIEKHTNRGLCYDNWLNGYIPLPVVTDLEIKKCSSTFI